jgi:hypothetical protein
LTSVIQQVVATSALNHFIVMNMTSKNRTKMAANTNPRKRETGSAANQFVDDFEEVYRRRKDGRRSRSRKERRAGPAHLQKLANCRRLEIVEERSDFPAYRTEHLV